MLQADTYPFMSASIMIDGALLRLGKGRNFKEHAALKLFLRPRIIKLRSKINYRGVSYAISRRLSLYVCINNDRWRSIDGAKRKVNYGKEGTLKNMAHLLACCILSRFSFRQIDITKLSRLSTANCCVATKSRPVTVYI